MQNYHENINGIASIIEGVLIDEGATISIMRDVFKEVQRRTNNQKLQQRQKNRRDQTLYDLESTNDAGE